MAQIDDRLYEEIKSTMKAGEKEKTETFRTLRAQIKDARIKKGDDLEEIEEQQVLMTAAKRRKESIEMFKNGNRDDLVAKEKFQLDLIQKYLPEQISEEEIEKIVNETISTINVSSMSDMGRVMGVLMPKVKGKADGKIVQQKVKEALSKLT
ncbi:MAG: GatB/YqeY domain-containing protein [Calditrichia bacterium]|nr:GatB/YqeY domain-containing protein [Calditrichia bacterium]